MHRRGPVALSADGTRAGPASDSRGLVALVTSLLPLALACGKDPAAQISSAPPEPQAARTIDKGEGCVVQIEHLGSGPSVVVGDEVTIAYDMRLQQNEAVVASTRGWIAPCRVRVGDPGVIAGLSRGIDGLPVGSKAKIEVPPALGYGKEGCTASGVPADATLVFEVDVLGVRR